VVRPQAADTAARAEADGKAALALVQAWAVWLHENLDPIDFAARTEVRLYSEGFVVDARSPAPRQLLPEDDWKAAALAIVRAVARGLVDGTILLAPPAALRDDIRTRLDAEGFLRGGRRSEYDRAVAREQTHVQELIARAAEDDRRWNQQWGAMSNAEELYRRRASEVSTRQLLDLAGVPGGERSVNGRLALALGLRFASAAGSVGSDDDDEEQDRGPDDLTAALDSVPEGPWPVASSGVSLDVGSIRVRFDGGTAAERRALAQWISRSRARLEASLARPAPRGRRKADA
jgi:hypothetical protein